MRIKIAFTTGLAGGLAVALSAVLMAGSVGPLTSFSAGTTAKASEVNANFSAVKSAIDDNATRISKIESMVTDGNLVLEPSTATTGNVLKGTAPFIHNFGVDNTFVGVNAGNYVMTGTANTAFGVNSLTSNTTGGGNTAIGSSSLFHNTTGGDNTAIGSASLVSNTTGHFNTASGATALVSNTTGSLNTAFGSYALVDNTTGSYNTAFGSGALFNNTTGSYNIALGQQAGLNFTIGTHNIAIGNLGFTDDSQTIRIGTYQTQTRTFIAGIRGITTGIPNAVSVVIDADGQLGTVNSSRKVKNQIADMGEASSVLTQLRPVTFYYRSDKNPAGRTRQYGLVAEEVAKVAPELVARSADGSVETVYYHFLVPMLLNEYQKQQRTIEAQTLRIAELEKQTMEISTLKAQAVRLSERLARLEAPKVAAAR